MATAAHKRSRRRFLELACICFAVALLGWFVFPRLTPIIRTELKAEDQFIANGVRPPLKDNFVFVAIDEASFALDQLWPEDIAQSPSLKAMTGEFPWPRSVYADAIERILGSGAKIVVLDLLFNSPHKGDVELKRALDKYAHQVVIASTFSKDDRLSLGEKGAIASITLPSDSLIADPARDARVGYVNFWPDADKTVRTAIFETTLPELMSQPPQGSMTYRSITAATLRQLGLESHIPPGHSPKHFLFGPNDSVRVVPFYEIFTPELWKRNLKDGAVFRDKIVIIGPSASRFQDFHRTPVNDRMEGPLVHVNAIAAAMNGSFYRLASAPVSHLLIFLMSACALGISWRQRSPLIALASLLGTAALYLCVVYGLLYFFNYLLPVMQPVQILLIAGVCCISWNFAQTRRESGRMRSTLERYVSRNVVREILDNRDDFLTALGGTRRPVTLLFSDVRGFTSMVERGDEHAIVGQLNEYLGEMVSVIFRYNGTVDKFMGDGIMAVWGNVVSEGAAKDAEQAVAAALEMFERLSALNAEWAKRDIPPFAIGIGLHHGEAVFGNIGSSEKMEPTVIGDTVNLASRVEGLTKKYGVPLCITQPLAELVADKFLLRSVDLVQVVGKSRPIEILTVLGRRDIDVPDWIKIYEAAIADFRARRFAEAADALRQCRQAAPNDKLSAIYLERATAFIANPPPSDWTGTEIATSK